MNKFLYLIFGLIILYILIGLFLPRTFECNVVDIDINKGEGLERIAINLKDQGVIRSKNFLSSYIFIIDKATDVNLAPTG